MAILNARDLPRIQDGPLNSTARLETQPAAPIAGRTAGEDSGMVTPSPALTSTTPGPTTTGSGAWTQRLVTTVEPRGQALTTEEASSPSSPSSSSSPLSPSPTPPSPSPNASSPYTASPPALAAPHHHPESVSVPTAGPSLKPPCGSHCPGSTLGAVAQPANRQPANRTGGGYPEGGRFSSGTAPGPRQDGREAKAGDSSAAVRGAPWMDDRAREAASSLPLRAGPLVNRLSHGAVGGGHKMAAGKGGNWSDGQSPPSAPRASDLFKHDGIALDNPSRAVTPGFNRNVTNGVLGASAATAIAAGLGAELDLLTSAKASGPGYREAPPQPRAPLPPDCTPLPPSLGFCRPLGRGDIQLPNHLHQASMAEIQEAARSWGALLASGCHPGLVPFICRLLAPSCGPTRWHRGPPCRGDCEAVRDDCWTELAGSGLQLPCHLLPDAEEGGRCQSLAVGR
eukprot:g35621.t1